MIIRLSIRVFLAKSYSEQLITKIPNMKFSGNDYFYAVLDGHDGSEVAHFSRDTLIKEFCRSIMLGESSDLYLCICSNYQNKSSNITLPHCMWLLNLANSRLKTIVCGTGKTHFYFPN